VEVAAAHGVPVVDLYTSFRDANQLFADESHFTKEGHRQAAALIAQHLLHLLE
jgi:lysophospholipase L1-like esterase